MHDERTLPPDGEAPAGILDVRELALDVVLHSDHPVLTNAIQRVLRDMGESGEGWTAFGNTP